MTERRARCGQRRTDARLPVGEQRSFALELLRRAPQVRRHARRRSRDVEGRQTRTREQVKRSSKSGLKPRRTEHEGGKAMSLNRVTLIGHLGQDPGLRHLLPAGSRWPAFRSRPMMPTPTGRAIVRSGLTGTTSVVFGKAFESCKKYLKKAREVIR